MKQEKSLDQLTIKDNFMFGAVMSQPEICKEFLELVLEIPIDHVVVDTEKNFIYNPDNHSIRLDVYAKDPASRHFDVEIQVRRQNVIKRSRYYHASMDVDFLQHSESYDSLPDMYVIFVCDFDPLGDGFYRYMMESVVKGNPNHVIENGQHTVYLNTVGIHTHGESDELIKTLHYIHANLEDSGHDFDSPFVARLQQAVSSVKESRQMRNNYMTLHELIRDERLEAREEALAEGRAAGREEGRLLATRDMLQALCMKQSLTFEQAMDLLNISVEDREALRTFSIAE